MAMSDKEDNSCLTGRHVQLVPLTRRDYDFVFDLEVMGPAASRYRFRGTTPSPERFPELMWAGVYLQYVILWRRTGARIGTVMCYGADFRNRHARIAGALVADPPSPYALEGFALFLDHLFRECDLRKVYGDTLEPNAQATWSAVGAIVHEEGRLRDHEFFNGRYRDLLMLAIYREEWQALRQPGDAVPLAQATDRLRALSQALGSQTAGSPLADRLRKIAQSDSITERGHRSG